MRPIYFILTIRMPEQGFEKKMLIWMNHYYYYILKILYNSDKPVHRSKFVRRFLRQFPSYRRSILNRSINVMCRKGLLECNSDRFTITDKGKAVYEALTKLFNAYGVSID